MYLMQNLVELIIGSRFVLLLLIDRVRVDGLDGFIFLHLWFLFFAAFLSLS